MQLVLSGSIPRLHRLRVGIPVRLFCSELAHSPSSPPPPNPTQAHLELAVASSLLLYCIYIRPCAHVFTDLPYKKPQLLLRRHYIKTLAMIPHC